MPRVPRDTSLRLAVQFLRSLTCDRCGGRLATVATAWRGRGTGQRGASHYAATSFERATIDSHCICPNHVVCREIAGRLDAEQRTAFEARGEQYLAGVLSLADWRDVVAGYAELAR